MPTQQEMKQREQEAWEYAWGINPRYHSFVEAIERGGRDDNGRWVKTLSPYLNVDGMLLAARDEHRQARARLSILPPTFKETEGGEYDSPVQWDDKKNPTEYKRFKKLGELVIVVGVESELYGTSYGSAEVDFYADVGAAKDYPVRVAETHALGRALDHMGYTFHNPWLRGEIGNVAQPENQAEQVDMADVAGEKTHALSDAIQNKGISEDDAWTAIGLIQFTDQAELDLEIRHQTSIDKLTPKVFGAMVRAFREEAGLSEQECRDHIKPKLAKDLNLEEQLELIEWIKGHREQQAEDEQPSEVDEVGESIARMIATYANKWQVSDKLIANSMVLYANNEEDNNYQTLQEIPPETVLEMFKNDDVMKKIIEEAKSNA